MEKFIYWIKRTLHHSKHCNSLCISNQIRAGQIGRVKEAEDLRL